MKKVASILIVLIIIFAGYLTLYKSNNDSKDKDVLKEHYFIKNEIIDYKPEYQIGTDDDEVYKDKIILDNVLSTEFNLFSDEGSISGKVYIYDDGLYITNDNNNISYKVSTTKFKTLYVKDYQYINGIYVYLISQKNEAYMMYLEGNDVTKTSIYKFDDSVKFTNFVDMDFASDIHEIGNTLFALSDDGNIYDVNSGLRYDERVVSLYNHVFVFDDKTMTNSQGKIIVDKKGNSYKIKNIFYSYDSKKFIEDNSIVIITEDNKFIYFDNEMMYVYEFDKKVKNIEFDVYYPYIDGKLEITFEDDYKVEFTARCNEYFCINKFAE